MGCFTRCTSCHTPSIISIGDYKVFIAGGSAALFSANANINGAPAIGTTLDIGTTVHMGGTLLNIERDDARLSIGMEYTATNTAQSSSRNLWSLYFTTSSIDQNRFFMKTLMQQVQKLNRRDFVARFAALENYLKEQKRDASLIKSINAIFGFGNSDCKKSGFTYGAFSFFFGLLFHIDAWMALELRVVCTAREADFDFLTGNSTRNAQYKLTNPFYQYDPDVKGSIGLVGKAVIFIV